MTRPWRPRHVRRARGREGDTRACFARATRRRRERPKQAKQAHRIHGAPPQRPPPASSTRASGSAATLPSDGGSPPPAQHPGRTCSAGLLRGSAAQSQQWRPPRPALLWPTAPKLPTLPGAASQLRDAAAPASAPVAVTAAAAVVAATAAALVAAPRSLPHLRRRRAPLDAPNGCVGGLGWAWRCGAALWGGIERGAWTAAAAAAAVGGRRGCGRRRLAASRAARLRPQAQEWRLRRCRCAREPWARRAGQRIALIASGHGQESQGRRGRRRFLCRAAARCGAHDATYLTRARQMRTREPSCASSAAASPCNPLVR